MLHPTNDRTCRKCELILSVGCFTKGRSICRKCDNIKTREYYKKNRAKVLERQKKHQRANPVKTKEIKNKYYKNNKDKVLAFQKVYRKVNKELIRNKLKINVEALTDGYVAHMLKRQIRIQNVPTHLIEAKRNLILVKRLLKS